MIEFFSSAFVTFLVIIDPPGAAPIFSILTQGANPAQRRSMAIRSALVAWIILMVFGLLGRPLLDTLGISLASFRIAGGILLFYIAFEMVFEQRKDRKESRAHAIEGGTPDVEDISVFPMGMPMIAGPGAIASVMLWISRADDKLHIVLVLGAMSLVVLLTLGAMLIAGPLMKFIGAKIEAAITRILAVILSALAAQFVIDGLKDSFPGTLG
ncbi:MAG: MarC family protein [Pseudomonadota bacterium]